MNSALAFADVKSYC